jgi:hypothetical protein
MASIIARPNGSQIEGIANTVARANNELSFFPG